MARGKKDSLAARGSGRAHVEMEEEEAPVRKEEEEWKDEGEDEEEEEEEEEWVQEEEEDEEETDEAAAEEPAQAVEDEQVSPPKLADGFYEIEDIRRRRRRKGQLQYLVKWRGWPENANTWEPCENLQACPDLVDAFKKRRQPRSYGKRKRRISTTPVTSSKPSDRKRGRPRQSDPQLLPYTPARDTRKLPIRACSRRATNSSNKNSVSRLDTSVNGIGQEMLGQSVPHEDSSNLLSPELPCQAAPLPLVVQQQAEDQTVVVQQQDQHQPVDGLSNAETSVQALPSQGVQMTRAKKRKSGSVKRFKQDKPMQKQGRSDSEENENNRNEDVDSTGGTVDKNKGEGDASQLHITKIIKPIRYLATVTNDVQEVSLTFKALRSDGQEVVVDNKGLKVTDPLVLINFYEQHLRYNPAL